MEESVNSYDMLNLPQISLFTIIYHVVKCQIPRSSTDCDMKKNLMFALMLFSSNTMGPSFNVRLYSQYLMIQLLNITTDPEICEKYAVMKDTVLKILSQLTEEKNMKKLENDFYVNKFNPIRDLTVDDLYYKLPKIYGVSKDEWICFAPGNIGSNIQLDNSENEEIGITGVDGLLTNVQKKFLPSKPLLGDLQLPVEEINEQVKCPEGFKKSHNFLVYPIYILIF